MRLEPVRPVQPIAPWLGGKRALSRRIGERIAEIPHTRYVEPFVGMGGVFFRRPLRPKLEVINDVNRDVVTLFRILQRHYQQLLDVLKFQLYSRADFERLRATPADQLTDLERAARFLYIQKASFGGMGRSFGIDYQRPRWSLSKLEPMLEAVHERLEDVLIECLDFGTCIERYDSRPGTLFYCDPPYWGHTDDYGKDIFSEADFGRLRRLLGGLQGHFILSLNDRPEVREMFAGFEMEEVSLHYGAGGGQRPAKELIISG
ncbi:DNA adenine methylase [Erythrobacter colymbi]|uniref:DNA adenine methylase n=1 Tax=Erythrobacter colymbi TaxID=1161202 RepID=UPI000A384A88|nr:DNA adenine methylase [Erythrobacter colymbi]